jgi:hypothetical protein
MTARMPVAMVSLILAVLLASLAAEAQEAGKVYRVGVLETTPIALNAPNLNAFRLGLKELGYVGSPPWRPSWFAQRST